MVVLHTAIAIVLVIGLIIRGRVDPVISLILGSLYLGLASGVGFTGTLEAITARLRRDHGQGRAADRLRGGDRVAAACHRRVQAHGLGAGVGGRPEAAALRHGRGDVDDLPLDLRRRAGRAGLAGGPVGRAAPRPQRPAAARGRDRHRHLLRLRLRRARPRGDPDRRAGRRQPRRLAVLGPADRARHRARHHLPLPDAAPDRLLEARDRRGPGRGDAGDRGPRRRDRRRARRRASRASGSRSRRSSSRC